MALNQEYTKTTIDGVDYYEVNLVTPKGVHKGERSYMCDVCSLEYPAHLTIEFRGKIYCRPNGCYRDIESIKMLEKGAQGREPPVHGKPEVVGVRIIK